MKYSLLLGMWLVWQATGMAEPTVPDLLKELRSELQTAALAGQQTERSSALLQEVETAASNFDPAHPRDSGGIFDQLLSSAPNDRIRQLSRSLGAALKGEQAARVVSAVALVKKEVGDALRQFLDAQKASDMDGPIAALSRRGQHNSGDGGEMDRHARKAQEALEMMKSVQDSLSVPRPASTEEDGIQQRLLAGIRNSSSPYSQYDFSEYVPRSEMMQKLRAIEALRPVASSKPKDTTLQQVSTLLDEVKSLDQLTGALEAIDKFLPRVASPASASLMEVREINRLYQQIELGQATILPASLISGLASSPTAHHALQEKLVMYALPRVLQLTPAETAKPGESALTFLQRTLARGQKTHNWLLVARVLDAARVMRLPVGAGPVDQQALNIFLGGYNLERAHQYAPAVTAYLAVLKTGSQAIPAEEIGGILEEIKKAHPEDFQQGSHTEGSALGVARQSYPSADASVGYLTVPAAAVPEGGNTPAAQPTR